MFGQQLLVAKTNAKFDLKPIQPLLDQCDELMKIFLDNQLDPPHKANLLTEKVLTVLNDEKLHRLNSQYQRRLIQILLDGKFNLELVTTSKIRNLDDLKKLLDACLNVVDDKTRFNFKLQCLVHTSLVGQLFHYSRHWIGTPGILNERSKVGQYADRLQNEDLRNQVLYNSTRERLLADTEGLKKIGEHFPTIRDFLESKGLDTGYPTPTWGQEMLKLKL